MCCATVRDAQYAHFGSVLRTITRTGRSAQPIRCCVLRCCCVLRTESTAY
jgi:hypothetical protein